MLLPIPFLMPLFGAAGSAKPEDKEFDFLLDAVPILAAFTFVLAFAAAAINVTLAWFDVSPACERSYDGKCHLLSTGFFTAFTVIFTVIFLVALVASVRTVVIAITSKQISRRNIASLLGWRTVVEKDDLRALADAINRAKREGYLQ